MIMVNQDRKPTVRIRKSQNTCLSKKVDLALVFFRGCVSLWHCICSLNETQFLTNMPVGALQKFSKYFCGNMWKYLLLEGHMGRNVYNSEV